MFYVRTFDQHADCISDVPFEEKNTAIKYFNMKCDSKVYNEFPLMNYSRIEIWHDNVLLFEVENE